MANKNFYKKHIKDELKKVVFKPNSIRFSPFYLEKTQRMAPFAKCGRPSSTIRKLVHEDQEMYKYIMRTPSRQKEAIRHDASSYANNEVQTLSRIIT